LEVYRYTVPPRFDNSKAPLRHEGEELIHIVAGLLIAQVGNNTFTLEEGDSITYDATLPHYQSNPGDVPAIAIAAVTPPSF
jgi:quercetin dioxygenase-like cupin family protein